MKIQVKYADGRLDVFDTNLHTPAQPFGDGCLLADYELHFEDMRKGLWLQAHYYCATSLLLDTSGPPLVSKLQSVVDALRVSGVAADDERAA